MLKFLSDYHNYTLRRMIHLSPRVASSLYCSLVLPLPSRLPLSTRLSFQDVKEADGGRFAALCI